MYDEEDLKNLNLLHKYEERWSYIFVDLAKAIFYYYHKQPASVKLTQEECCKELACTLKARSASFRKFIKCQNSNLPADAYLDLAQPFAQYVVAHGWSTISDVS